MKSKPKKSLLKSSLSLALGIFLIGQTIVPKNAQAYLLCDGSLDDNGSFDFRTQSEIAASTAFNVILCISVLPFCLLDEKAPGGASVSVEDLKANLYSDQEIEQLQNEQSRIVDGLKKRTLQLKIESGETRTSLATAFREINPNVSHLYVDFVADSLGIVK